MQQCCLRARPVLQTWRAAHTRIYLRTFSPLPRSNDGFVTRHACASLVQSYSYCNAFSDFKEQKIITVPNILSLSRIVITPVIGYLVIKQQFTPAFSLFVFAGLTDLADGYIARKFKGQRSLLGSVLDPVADKFLVSIMFITMCASNLVPVPLTVIILLRDIFLVTGGVYKRYKTMKPPHTLQRFFDPRISSVQIVPTLIGKFNTALQLSLVAFSLANAAFDFGQPYEHLSNVLIWTTAATTIVSGFQYAKGGAFRRV